jgi:hypothetical protein
MRLKSSAQDAADHEEEFMLERKRAAAIRATASAETSTKFNGARRN